MDVIVEKYRDRIKRKKLSNNTVESYVRDINGFLQYLHNEYQESYKNAKKSHVLTYLVELQKRGKSSATIARNISSLKGFYEFLRDEREITICPTDSIHSPKFVKKIPVVLTTEEINMLMDLPDKTKFRGCRDSAILELLYSTGIKVTELISIKLEDISFNGSLIQINSVEKRVVPVGDIALKALTEYIENYWLNKVADGNEFIFVGGSGKQLTRQGVWKILKFYEKKLAINKEITPQILRNSFAVHLLNNGADIVSVQEIMGQKNLTAMQGYVQAVNKKHLEVIKKAHPRA